MASGPFSEHRATPHAATSHRAGPLQLGANGQAPSEEHGKKHSYCLLLCSARRETFIAGLTQEGGAVWGEEKRC